MDPQPARSPRSPPAPCSKGAGSALRPWEPPKRLRQLRKGAGRFFPGPRELREWPRGLQPSCAVWADTGEGWRGPRAKNLSERVHPGPLHLPREEYRHEITPGTLQKCLFPVTLARHGRQQPGRFSFYLLPPIAPSFRCGIGTARFPGLWFAVPHVSCSAARAARAPVPRWVHCLRRASAFLHPFTHSAQKSPVKSDRGVKKTTPGAPPGTVTHLSQENHG